VGTYSQEKRRKSTQKQQKENEKRMNSKGFVDIKNSYRPCAANYGKGSGEKFLTQELWN